MSIIKIAIRLKAPLSHGDPALSVDTGNFKALRKQAVAGLGDVPILSGNAIRGVMRRLLMRHFLAAAGMTPEAYADAPGHWDRIYAALANGGTLVGAEKSVQTGMLRRLRAAVPPLSLLGSALYTYMLPGMLSVFDAYPRCQEVAEAGLCEPSDASLADLYADCNHARHISPEIDKAAADITPMPYSHEVLIPGVILDSAIKLDASATEIERDCAAWALARIDQLGGNCAKGMGLVEILPIGEIGDPARYGAWVAEHAPAARAVIEEAIPARIVKA